MRLCVARGKVDRGPGLGISGERHFRVPLGGFSAWIEVAGQAALAWASGLGSRRTAAEAVSQYMGSNLESSTTRAPMM